MAKQSRQRAKATRKRREKKARQRRTENPFRLAGQGGDLDRCLINCGWKDDGIAMVFVLRRLPGASIGMAVFLIDVWCLGLKDAWGRLDMTSADFEELIASRPDMPCEEIDFSTVRRLVAGSIRFARENGFRLPRRYHRWLALAGIDAHDDADLSDFRHDGDLVYVGAFQDLRERLIGQPPEQFLDRDDVRFAVGMEDGRVFGNCDELVDELLEWSGASLEELDDHPIEIPDAESDDEELEDVLGMCRTRMLEAVRRWCIGNGIDPHPSLDDAWDLNELALLTAPTESPSDVEITVMRQSVDALLERRAPREREALRLALDQIRGFIDQFESDEAMLAAIDRGQSF